MRRWHGFVLAAGGIMSSIVMVALFGAAEAQAPAVPDQPAVTAPAAAEARSPDAAPEAIAPRSNGTPAATPAPAPGKMAEPRSKAVAAAPPAAAAVPSAAGPVYPALFGSREIRGSSFAPFPKWTGLIERQVNESALYEGPCSALRFNRCHLQEWRALLKSLQGKDRRTQADAVNRFMNRAPYIIDQVNYRVSDYWATPLQFLNKDGDCEDYAIAKFISLRELGFANDQLRIVILDDLNLGVAHAILVVYLDGEAFVLDNQQAKVVPAAKVRHYRPIYSINEEHWWLHRVATP